MHFRTWNFCQFYISFNINLYKWFTLVAQMCERRVMDFLKEVNKIPTLSTCKLKLESLTHVSVRGD